MLTSFLTFSLSLLVPIHFISFTHTSPSHSSQLQRQLPFIRPPLPHFCGTQKNPLKKCLVPTSMPLPVLIVNTSRFPHSSLGLEFGPGRASAWQGLGGAGSRRGRGSDPAGARTRQGLGGVGAGPGRSWAGQGLRSHPSAAVSVSLDPHS